MKYYVLSDNQFFLSGLESVMSYNFARSACICVQRSEELMNFHPSAGDVVVVALENIQLRNALMSTPGLLFCRVIIMLRAGFNHRLAASFSPWIIAGNIAKKDFIDVLCKVKRIAVKAIPVPAGKRGLFFLLAKGLSHEAVARHFHLSDKSVYGARRKMCVQLGLNNCNTASGILLCRDILILLLNSRCTIPHEKTNIYSTEKPISQQNITVSDTVCSAPMTLKKHNIVRDNPIVSDTGRTLLISIY